MAQASEAFCRLARSSRRELEHLLLVGDTPNMDALDGGVYRGFNHSPVTATLRIRKFLKEFFRSNNGDLEGRNARVRQNRLEDPWIGLPSDAAPKRYGYFSVRPVAPEERDNAYLHAVLFDYGTGRSPSYAPWRLLRDYVVRVNRGSDELLLGKAYAVIGPGRLPLGFFVLERRRGEDDEAGVRNKRNGYSR